LDLARHTLWRQQIKALSSGSAIRQQQLGYIASDCSQQPELPRWITNPQTGLDAGLGAPNWPLLIQRSALDLVRFGGLKQNQSVNFKIIIAHLINSN
jgi:hypothetical protein